MYYARPISTLLTFVTTSSPSFPLLFLSPFFPFPFLPFLSSFPSFPFLLFLSSFPSFLLFLSFFSPLPFPPFFFSLFFIFCGASQHRISKGGVFQPEPQATGGTRRQVESPTAANGKKTFGSTGHGIKGVFCTEVRTNGSVWGRRKSRCRTERSDASRIRCVRVSE